MPSIPPEVQKLIQDSIPPAWKANVGEIYKIPNGGLVEIVKINDDTTINYKYTPPSDIVVDKPITYIPRQKEKKNMATKDEYEQFKKQDKYEENFDKTVKNVDDLNTKVGAMEPKLEKVCTTVDGITTCVNKGFEEVNKKLQELEDRELYVCEKCGKKVVPELASFCPACGFPVPEWLDDDGKPVETRL